MSCTLHDQKPDWKAYSLGELDPAARREAEIHAGACAECHEELAGLRLTLDALATLREEEVPRRIAFVSDKVFEPRWWQSILRPSFAASFAASFAVGGLIAAAILAHGFVRPPAPAQIDMAVLEKQMEQQIEKEVAARVEGQVAERIHEAVTQAVAQTEQREEQKTATVLAATEKRYTEQRRADFATAAANYDMLFKQVTKMYAVNTGVGVR
jgi:hypothetical protein